jgi:prolyl-tRNA synthetase
MLYSQLFGKTLKIVPAEAETVSHKLLLKAGFLDRALTAGVYTLLPLGWRVYKKIENIIREEMDRIGCQELLMPTLQPKALWQETDRWLKYDPPLFKLKDRHQKDLCLAPTHEEVITDLVRRFVTSYKDLPLYLYHIQNKFRNEMRPTSGLLRTREFMMKDLYSFHQDKKDLDQFYTRVIEAYKSIFRRCHLVVKVIEASGGSIGGEVTHEFNMLCPTGEDKVLYCPKCDFAANSEIYHEKKCKNCQTVLIEGRGIENGHIFKLDTRYAQAMKAYYVDARGRKQLLWMGCYGIGLQRLLATIVEAHHDEKGIIWPRSVAPYQVHLIQVGHEGLKGASFAHEIYQKLIEEKIEVLYDDREVSAGVKFSDADLLGLPIRLVISERTAGRVEWKERTKEKKELLSLGQLIKRLKEKN